MRLKCLYIHCLYMRITYVQGHVGVYKRYMLLYTYRLMDRECIEPLTSSVRHHVLE